MTEYLYDFYTFLLKREYIVKEYEKIISGYTINLIGSASRGKCKLYLLPNSFIDSISWPDERGLKRSYISELIRKMRYIDDEQGFFAVVSQHQKGTATMREKQHI
jgi:hypothetical protein